MAGAGPEGAGQPELSPRLYALRSRAERARQDTLEAWARAQELKTKLAQAAGMSRQELLTRSPLARLQARAATMPVIEQAKGVLMAQQGCDAAAAFDLLRRASQRSNVPVRVLAERIITTAQRQAHRPCPLPDSRAS